MFFIQNFTMSTRYYEVYLFKSNIKNYNKKKLIFFFVYLLMMFIIRKIYKKKFEYIIYIYILI